MRKNDGRLPMLAREASRFLKWVDPNLTARLEAAIDGAEMRRRQSDRNQMTLKLEEA